MALHRLIDIELGSPVPADRETFYSEIGLRRGNRRWDTADAPDQLRIAETEGR